MSLSYRSSKSKIINQCTVWFLLLIRILYVYWYRIFYCPIIISFWIVRTALPNKIFNFWWWLKDVMQISVYPRIVHGNNIGFRSNFPFLIMYVPSSNVFGDRTTSKWHILNLQTMAHNKLRLWLTEWKIILSYRSLKLNE